MVDCPPSISQYRESVYWSRDTARERGGGEGGREGGKERERVVVVVVVDNTSWLVANEYEP